ncbi:MAG: adenosylcobinamide-GDP ribazoletransferase [Henriciella sp.]
MKHEVASFLLAVQFLTRLPIPTGTLFTPERMAASARYYPLVGVLIGGFCALVFYGASILFPQLIAVIISVGAGLLLTGAFHEDGLADTFDGIGGGHTAERALEIMKDSRLGTYGTLALIIVLALKAAALAALPSALVMTALVAGHGLSRLSSVLVISTSRYVRAHGTGKPVADGLSPAGLLIALITGVLIIAGWSGVAPIIALLYALVGLALGHVILRLFFERKLGGYTGDTLGAVQQISEIGFYLGLLAWL